MLNRKCSISFHHESLSIEFFSIKFKETANITIKNDLFFFRNRYNLGLKKRRKNKIATLEALFNCRSEGEVKVCFLSTNNDNHFKCIK